MNVDEVTRQSRVFFVKISCLHITVPIFFMGTVFNAVTVTPDSGSSLNADIRILGNIRMPTGIRISADIRMPTGIQISAGTVLLGRPV